MPSPSDSSRTSPPPGGEAKKSDDEPTIFLPLTPEQAFAVYKLAAIGYLKGNSTGAFGSSVLALGNANISEITSAASGTNLFMTPSPQRAISC